MASEASEDPRLGSVLQDRYRITARLSAGAMGAVYRGERLQLGRAVAVKFLHAAFMREGEFTRRFEQEARVMSRLSHPHCVSVIDFGVADVPYVVMDYVAGHTLRDLLEKGPLHPTRSIQIVKQVLAGLAHAHGKGVVHRDIKPANIMLTEATGTGDHVRILDFGLAKLLTPGEQSATAPMAIGTPAYMSPEQARGDTVDARADLYAVGILLYELLTGEKPFVADEAFSIIRKQLEEAPPSLAAQAPKGSKFSTEMERVIARALAKKPEDRFQNAQEMVDALDATPEARLRYPPLPTRKDLRNSTVARAETVLVDEPGEAPARRGGRGFWLLGLAVVLVAGFASAALVVRPELRARVLGRKPAPAATPGAGDPTPQFLAEPVQRPEPGSDPAPTPTSTAPGDAARPAPPPPPRPVTVRDAEAMLNRGENENAYDALIKLRREYPKNAYVHLLLGHAQFDKLYWSDGIDSYQAALTFNGDYRKLSRLNQNLIRALGHDKTRRAAETLVLKKIGRAALPHLDRAAKTDKNKDVRKRAAALASRLRRGR